LQFNALNCEAKVIGKRSLRLKPRHSLLFGEASEMGGKNSSEMQQFWKSTVEMCRLKAFKDGVSPGSAKGKPLLNSAACNNASRSNYEILTVIP
jgi:hypothetical protein